MRTLSVTYTVTNYDCHYILIVLTKRIYVTMTTHSIVCTGWWVHKV